MVDMKLDIKWDSRLESQYARKPINAVALCACSLHRALEFLANASAHTVTFWPEVRRSTINLSSVSRLF